MTHQRHYISVAIAVAVLVFIKPTHARLAAQNVSQSFGGAPLTSEVRSQGPERLQALAR